MATVNKLTLSASTNGRQTLVTNTATPGTLLHTASNVSNTFDEVWLYATNNDTDAVALNIEFGGTTSPNDIIKASIPPQEGLYLLVPGLVISSNTNALAVRAFASKSNVVSVSGWINRII
jgi:hypothetical protein